MSSHAVSIHCINVDKNMIFQSGFVKATFIIVHINVCVLDALLTNDKPNNKVVFHWRKKCVAQLSLWDEQVSSKYLLFVPKTALTFKVQHYNWAWVSLSKIINSNKMVFFRSSIYLIPLKRMVLHDWKTSNLGRLIYQYIPSFKIN